MSMRILERLAEGRRITRDEAEELRGDIEGWNGNAETRREQMERLVEADFADLIDAASSLADLGGSFADLHSLVESLSNAAEDLTSTMDLLGEFCNEADEFAGVAETWIEKDGGPEEIAEALEQMQSYAEQLRQLKEELLSLGVDVEAEA